MSSGEVNFLGCVYESERDIDYYDLSEPFGPNEKHYNVTLNFYKIRVETQKSYMLQLEAGKPEAIWVPKKIAIIKNNTVEINKTCYTKTTYKGEDLS